MELDEAIKHCRDKAEELRKEKRRMALLGREDEWGECLECAEEHEQLAEWLEELKILRTEKVTPAFVHVIIHHPKYGDCEGWLDKSRQLLFTDAVSTEFAKRVYGWPWEEDEK